ncbi:hypothetical protein B0H17DRAFT_1197888 [Mycena rosella]|uniref:Uncharacterized protein n=1 Tax=Mycena rosella TaxID=1033263 RepID=A0AAD7GP11_MYCRO|nr:hypothetical protein B0H17DRAFT_1197888 [Mycena rosella]
MLLTGIRRSLRQPFSALHTWHPLSTSARPHQDLNTVLIACKEFPSAPSGEEFYTLGDLVANEDYPAHWTRPGVHPSDYTVSDTMIKPEHIYHENNIHARMWFRTSLRLPNQKYTHLTFLVHTGAGQLLALECLVIHKRLKPDHQLRLPNGIGVNTLDTPRMNEPVNFIGAKLTMQLGLTVRDGRWNWLKSSVPNW